MTDNSSNINDILKVITETQNKLLLTVKYDPQLYEFCKKLYLYGFELGMGTGVLNAMIMLNIPNTKITPKDLLRYGVEYLALAIKNSQKDIRDDVEL